MRDGLVDLVGEDNAAKAESILQHLKEEDAGLRKLMEGSGKTFQEISDQSRGADEFSVRLEAGDILSQQLMGVVLKHQLPDIAKRVRQILPNLHPDFAYYLQNQEEAFWPSEDLLYEALNRFVHELFSLED